jgi:UDP-N-acetyl-D-mannosaminuronate dehydrogenase
VIQRVQERLNEQGKSVNGSSILLLGVTYKPDVADLRESPALPIVRGLARRGSRVAFHDPYVGSIDVAGQTLQRVGDRDSAIAGADLVVLVQDHRDYRYIDALVAPGRLLNTRGQ